MIQKKFVLALLLTVSATVALGQSFQTQWDPNGEAIRQGKHIEWFRSGVSSDSGSVLYTWSDTRNGYRDVFIQKVDPDGNKLFGGNGATVVSYDNRQEDPVLVSDGAGGAIVFWVDFRADSTGDIYGQHINSDGEQLWLTSGLPFCVLPKTQVSLRMTADDNGGAFAVWLDNRNGNATDIYGIHVQADGTIESGWAENGNPVVTAGGDQNQHSLVKDGTGGAIVAWRDTRQSSDPEIYAQRLLADGTMSWAENGINISNASEEQASPKLAFTGTSGVFAAWQDFQADLGGDIRAQRIKPDGSFDWGAGGIAVCDLNSAQKNPRVIADSNAFYISWEDFRNNPVDADIYAQKLDSLGNVEWLANGVQATGADNGQEEPRITLDELGGAYIVWTDYRAGGFPNVDIYVQHIDAAGLLTMDPNGGVVCNAPYAQGNPLIRPDGDHGAIVAWGDARTGSIGIYVQRLDAAGDVYWTPNGASLYYGIDGDALDIQPLLGDNGDLALYWEDHRRGTIGTHIYTQRLDQSGSAFFAQNGLEISSYDTLYQSLPVVTRANSGAEINYVAWEDQTTERSVRAQRVDANGASLWDEAGLPVENAAGEGGYPQLAATPDGGVIVGWSDFRSFYSYQVYLQKFDTDGNPQWTEDGVLVGDEDGDNLLMGMHPVTDGVYVVWQSGTFEDLNIYVDFIGYDGAPVSGWEDGSKPVVNVPEDQTNPVLVPGDSESLYVLWEDKRNGDSDIYVNQITPGGVRVDGGTLVIGGPSDQRKPQAVLCENGLFVATQDFRNGVDLDISYQLFDTWDWMTSGDLGYIIQHDGSQSNLDLKKMDDGSILAAWEDDRELNDSDIYAQWFASNGYGPLWDPNGVLINAAINKQNVPQIVPDSSNGAYIVWLDNRSSGKTELFNIYGQYISNLATGTEEPFTAVPLTFSVEQNYPNPFNPTTTIPYAIPQPGDVTFTIFDLRGAEVWRTIRHHQSAGEYQLKWNGRTSSGKKVASGNYFLRVTQNNQAINRKLIVIE